MAPPDFTSSDRGAGRFVEDPVSGRMAEVRTVQPYAALKVYRCPGCNHEIKEGTFHLVVIPLGEPGQRRHWHRGCFDHRGNRPLR